MTVHILCTICISLKSVDTPRISMLCSSKSDCDKNQTKYPTIKRANAEIICGWLPHWPCYWDTSTLNAVYSVPNICYLVIMNKISVLGFDARFTVFSS